MRDTGISLKDDHYANVAEAFSRKAVVYDQFGENHINLARMRDKVRKHVVGLLEPGANILELAAGTGGDAVYFAKRGFQVLATDIAPGMVVQIREKVANYQLAGNLRARQLSFTHLDDLPDKHFDLVFSNMGGLNCIPDLSQASSELPRILKAGGWVVWVVMPRICLWELGTLMIGDFKSAFRRLSLQGSLANVEGVQFVTYYFTPEQVMQALGADFELISAKGVSVFTPPADRKNFASRFPTVYRILVGLDDLLADRAPFNRWGDFFMITARYCGV
jgi:ubiquinone/menaquinone biosynthesis C-methylase UbiE